MGFVRPDLMPNGTKWSADGGHYMGWVKREDGSWLVFDDDLVSESSWEFVQGLKGGGDEHMSYLQFYRAKKGGI